MTEANLSTMNRSSLRSLNEAAVGNYLGRFLSSSTVAIQIDDQRDLASTLQVLALGIVTVVGGQYYGWNEALSCGFVPFIIAQTLMAMGFVIYVACISEVGSQVNGGSYGLARAVLGFYPGFILSCLEILEYITFAAVSVLYVSHFVTAFFGWPEAVELAVCLVFYTGGTLLLHMPGRRLWLFMQVLLVFCLLPAVLFIASTISSANFLHNAPLRLGGTNTSVWACGSFDKAFLALLPRTTVGFAGIESLTLVTDFVRDPTKAIPRAAMTGVNVLIGIFVPLIFLVVSQPPGLDVIVRDEFVLSRGLYRGLGLDESSAKWLIMPAQVGTALGFFLPYARLTHAMANSNLLPGWLRLRNRPNTLRAMAVASVGGFVICIISFVAPAFEKTLQNISLLAGAICYCAQIYGFVLLRTTYKVDTTYTGYKSPFGLAGAYFAWAIFGLLVVSIAGGFQNDNGIAVVSLVAFVLILSLYYVRVCRTKQTVSPDEYASIFRYSVMKYNRKRRSRSSRHVSTDKISSFARKAKVYVT